MEKERGLLHGHIPGTLSATGIEQAKKLALRFKDEKLDVIYSSDLKRAADTAKEIAVFHPNTAINFTQELRERALGVFEGKTKAEARWDERGKNFRHPQDGESLEKAQARAKNFLDFLKEKHMRDTVLLVSHGDLIMALISAIENLSISATIEMSSTKETAVYIYEIDPSGFKVILKNSTEHLV